MTRNVAMEPPAVPQENVLRPIARMVVAWCAGATKKPYARRSEAYENEIKRRENLP